MKEQQTQKTAKGYEIPVPKRRVFDQMLTKAARPTKRRSAPRRPKK